MAISRVQVAYGGADASPASPVTTSLSPFPGNCTSGNWIIVLIRNGFTTISTPTDSLGTSYTLARSETGGNVDLRIYYGLLTSTGANTVSVAMGGAGTAYPWVYAIEVAGLAASPLDVATGWSAGGTTDFVTPSFSTAQADEYVVMAGSGTSFCTFTAGTDFTLVDGTIPTNAADFGGVQEYITTGTLSSYVPHMTANTLVAYTTILASFKGGSAPVPGVGAPFIDPVRLMLPLLVR